MFGMLAEHPEVEPPIEKENWQLYPSIWTDRPATREELASYLGAIPVVDNRVGLEAAPCNVYANPATAHALAEAVPAARVVIVVRDPVERLSSVFRFQRQRGLRRQSFDTFVRVNLVGLDARRQLQPGLGEGFHVRGGLYGHWIRPWVEAFGSRAAVIDVEALRTDAHATTRSLTEWAELEPFVSPPVVRRNVTRPRRRDRIRRRLVGPLDGLDDALLDVLREIHEADRERLEKATADAGLVALRTESWR